MNSASAQAQKLLAAFRSGNRPSFEDCVQSLGGLFPLLLKFRDTPQDKEWHAEGDVHIHTDMVLRALYRELDDTDENLSANERLTLFLAAILHDIAKPISTTNREIHGVVRTVSPKHEERGRSLIAQGLLELGLPYQLVRDVMGLVGYHQQPKFLVVKDKPAAEYRKLARLAPLRLIYFLERCDMLGRTCADQDDQVTYIELFKLEAQALGLWDLSPYQDWAAAIKARFPEGPAPFIDLALGQGVRDHEAGVITEAAEAVARSFSHKVGFASLYILVGPSGSGKSTWTAREMPGATVISLDSLRDEMAAGGRADQDSNGQVMQEAKRRLKEALAANQTVVWDATSLRVDFRRPLMELGLAYGALVTTVVFHLRATEVELQNANRRHAVSARVLAEQLERLQFPEQHETHRMLIIGTRGEVLYRAGYSEDTQPSSATESGEGRE